MSETTDEPFWARCGDTTPRDRRNLLWMMGTLVAWGLCFLGGSLLIARDLLPSGPVSWLAAILPSVVGIFVLVAYARFLREVDELQRIIQLQALALGFGGTFFVLTGYHIFQRLGAPDPDIAIIATAMALFYSFGSLLGWRRYR